MKKVKNLVLALMIIVVVFNCNIVCISASEYSYPIVPELIQKYIDLVNEEKYLDLAKYFCEESAQLCITTYSNENNIARRAGIMNVKNMQIIDIVRTDYFSAIDCLLEEEYILNELTEFYVLKIDMELYNKDSKYFIDGINYIMFTISEENGEMKLFDIIELGDEFGSKYFNQTESISSDSPVSSNGAKWTNPSKIIVRITSTGDDVEVDFKQYCKVVTANEYGKTGNNINAVRAVAMAVKNTGWRRMLSPRKYAAYAFDIKDSNADQIYNPNVDPQCITNVSYAVDSIWNYVMLDAGCKLFAGFHCKQYNANAASTSSAHWAKQYMGALSQTEAETLADNGMSWMDICRYYYDKVSNIEHIVSDFTTGEIHIVELNHSHVYAAYYYYDATGHYRRCRICGCNETKKGHTFGVTSKICSVCYYNATTDS